MGQALERTEWLEASEIWKPTPGFETLYEVSSKGRVRSLDRMVRYAHGLRRVPGRILSLSINTKGRCRCSLGERQRFKTIEVHRLIAKAFLAPVEGKNQINHKNGDPTDNRVENLEWCTHAENCQHAQDTGLNLSRYSERQKAAARVNIMRCNPTYAAKIGGLRGLTSGKN